mmetsp:Transcript_38922/g.90756  ORF Transcript_38922/g.90756 Transcript_38922/m.90756 type:complete len:818 (+) Transcript_38922:129-2582(+)
MKGVKSSQRSMMSSLSGGQQSQRSVVSFTEDSMGSGGKSSSKHPPKAADKSAATARTVDSGKGSSSPSRGSDQDKSEKTSKKDSGSKYETTSASNALSEGSSAKQGTKPGEGIYAKKKARVSKFSIMDPLGFMDPQTKKVFWYTLFIAFFSIGVFNGRPSSTTFFMLKTMSEKILYAKTADDIAWMDIRDVDSLWEWIRGPLIDVVYNDNTPGSKEGALLGYDYIINGVRIRQVRIKPEVCRPDLPEWAQKAFELSEEFGPRCYDAVRAGAITSLRGTGNEDTEPFGGIVDGERVFKWSENDAWAAWSLTELGSYPPNGYMMDLPAFNITKALDVVNLHQKYNFFDVQTRAIFLSMVTYNPNLNMLLLSRLTAEMSEFGGIVTSSSFQSVPLYIYDGFWGVMQLVFEGLFVLVLLKFVLEEVGWLLHLRAKFLYRFQGMFIILCFSLVCAVGLMRWTGMINIAGQTFIGEEQRTASSTAVHTTFKDLDNIGYFRVIEDNILGVLSVVIYLRFFLHLANSTVLKHIYGMLRSALFEILPFFVLFIIVFLGFSLGFYVVFGPYIAEYRSFMRTIVTNTRMIMGGNSELYEELYTINWIMAPLLYYTLAITAFVLLFNVFLAIIVHTYAMYKNELERDPEDRLKDGIYTTMAWILSFFGIHLNLTNRVHATPVATVVDAPKEDEPQEAAAGEDATEGQPLATDSLATDLALEPVASAPVMGTAVANVGVSPELEAKLEEVIKRSGGVDSLRTELMSVSDRLNALTEYLLAEPTSKIQKQVELVNRKLDLMAEALIAAQAGKGGGEDPSATANMSIPGWTD